MRTNLCTRTIKLIYFCTIYMHMYDTLFIKSMYLTVTYDITVKIFIQIFRMKSFIKKKRKEMKYNCIKI